MMLEQTVDSMYPESFFKTRHKLTWRMEIVCGAIQSVLKPSSVLDAGCAIGDLVAGFIALGIDAYGLEGSRNCMKYLVAPVGNIFFFDLRGFVPLDRRYDLVTCFEVAEHIEREFAMQFVGNLCKLSHRVLMSAAPPGQGGRHHVNCQPPEYWQEQFTFYDYGRERDIERRLKRFWVPWARKPGIKAYYDNLLYFEKKSTSLCDGVNA
jgi:SAM-dependent methyltransferase